MEESAFAEEEAAAPETYADATEPSPPTAEVALAHLDEAATALQREGRFLEALECMERGLVLRQRYYGVKSPEVFGEAQVLLYAPARLPRSSAPATPYYQRHARPLGSCATCLQ